MLTAQTGILDKKLHGEIPPGIARLGRCARFLRDLEHKNLSEGKMKTHPTLTQPFSYSGFEVSGGHD
jgi:hypothetical protein